MRRNKIHEFMKSKMFCTNKNKNFRKGIMIYIGGFQSTKGQSFDIICTSLLNPGTLSASPNIIRVFVGS